MMVVRSSHNFLNPSWIRCSVSVSTALVASSKRMISGRLRIARAIATRCFSPPDSFLHILQHVLNFNDIFNLHSSLADFRVVSYRYLVNEKHSTVPFIYDSPSGKAMILSCIAAALQAS